MPLVVVTVRLLTAAPPEASKVPNCTPPPSKASGVEVSMPRSVPPPEAETVALERSTVPALLPPPDSVSIVEDDASTTAPLKVMGDPSDW